MLYNDHMLFSFEIIKSASLLISPSFHVCVCKSITLQGFITFIVPSTSSEQCYSQDIPAKPGFLVTNIQVFINALLVFKKILCTFVWSNTFILKIQCSNIVGKALTLCSLEVIVLISQSHAYTICNLNAN